MQTYLKPFLDEAALLLQSISDSPVFSQSIFAASLTAGILCNLTIWIIFPLLQKYALARPNARSSHTKPTPQGAGIAVIAATFLTASFFGSQLETELPRALVISTIVIAIVGAVDDLKSIPVLPRLFLQGTCAAAAVYASSDGRIFDMLPLAVEQCLLFVAVVWFVNLCNFMDGLDLLTVAEVVPMTAALIVLGWLDFVSPAVMIMSAALGGAIIGFAPYNKPVARVFLGDAGSLAIGLLLAWALIELARYGNVTSALLLPLYYVMDATITLLRRLARRERVWVAHRSHFYQMATANGFTVTNVTIRVFGLNVGLAALAVTSAVVSSFEADIVLFAVGTIATAQVLYSFSRTRL